MEKKYQILLWLCFICLPTAILGQDSQSEASIRKQVKLEAKTQKQAAKTLKNASRSKYLVMGLTSRYGFMQDFRMSKLTYHGTGPGLIVAYRMRSPKVWQEFVFDPSLTFQTANNEQSFLLNPYGSMSYRYLRHLTDLGSEQDWHLYLGGEVEALANARINNGIGNSAFHWEGIGALNLAAAVQKQIKLPLIKTPVQMDYQLMIPVFGECSLNCVTL